MPTEIAGLRFWLDCGANPLSSGEAITELRKVGPAKMSAISPINGPHYISPCVNGKPALFFAAEKAEIRHKGPQGILKFGEKNDWSFMFNDSAFAVFAVFKPSVPGSGLWLQERALLLRIGATDRYAPAFVLQWNSDSNASEAIIINKNAGREIRTERQIASTPRGSHPRNEWRIINVQHTGEGKGTLSSFANGIPGAPCRGSCGQERRKTFLRVALQLGGAEGENQSLFFGAVAEMMIFTGSLEDQQRIGITRYLKDKYRL